MRVVGTASGALAMVGDDVEGGKVGSASACAAIRRRRDAWRSLEPDIVDLEICAVE